MEASDDKYEREEGRAIVINQDCLQMRINDGKNIELLGDVPLLQDQFQNLGGTFQSSPEPMWTFSLEHQSMVQDILRKEDIDFTTVIVQEDEQIDPGNMYQPTTLVSDEIEAGNKQIDPENMYQPTTLASDEIEVGNKTSTAEGSWVENPQFSESTTQATGDAMEVSTTTNVNLREQTSLDKVIPEPTGNNNESNQPQLVPDTADEPTNAGITNMLESPPLLRHSPEPAPVDKSASTQAVPVAQSPEPHIVQHSTRSIALLGDTKPWTAQLNTVGGGKFKKNFKVGEVAVAGWTFPRGKLEEVKKIVPSATVIPIADVDKYAPATVAFSPKKRKHTATEA